MFDKSWRKWLLLSISALTLALTIRILIVTGESQAHSISLIEPNSRTSLHPISNVKNIAAGHNHTCAVTTTGAVKCWGFNREGEIGDGTTVNHNTPVDVSNLSSGVKAISAGWAHTCAITNGDGVKCWGQNYAGQLGDGSNINRTTPVDVVGLTSGIIAISAGGDFTCALTSGGSVKCWGNNYWGQLGDGTGTSSLAPVDVTDLTSGVKAISASYLHTCAVTTTGAVKCWGYNDSGQLGDGTITNRYAPIDVANLSSGVTAISSGWAHTCAITDKTGIKCWGRNDIGQLGDGSTIERHTPVDVIGLASGATAIVTGWDHTCVLVNNTGVKCWGFNENGQMGDGTTFARKAPVDVIGLSSGITTISTSYLHTCAITGTGSAKCWGYNYTGQLGDDTNIDRSTPVDVMEDSNIVTPTPTATPTSALTVTPEVISSGFDMQKDSWSFNNADLEIEWQNFEDAYGKSAVTTASGEHISYAQRYFDDYVKSLGDDGLCYGFVATSWLRFAGLHPNEPEEVRSHPNLYDVPEPSHIWFTGWFDHVPVSMYLGNYQIYQNGADERKWQENADGAKPKDVVESLKASIKSNLQVNPVALVFFGPLSNQNGGPCHGHIVLPIAYKVDGDKTYITTYDSNSPHQQDLVVQSNGDWQFGPWNNTQICNETTDNGIKSRFTEIAAMPLNLLTQTPKMYTADGSTDLMLVSETLASVSGNGLTPIPVLTEDITSTLAPTNLSYIYSGTTPINISVEYSNTKGTLHVFNNGSYIGVTALTPHLGATDKVEIKLAGDDVQVGTQFDNTRQIEQIKTLEDRNEVNQILTCTMTSQTVAQITLEADKSNITSNKILPDCTIKLKETGKTAKNYALPVIEGADLVMLTHPDSNGKIIVSVDHGSDGSVDNQQVIAPINDGFNLYLPIVR